MKKGQDSGHVKIEKRYCEERKPRKQEASGRNSRVKRRDGKIEKERVVDGALGCLKSKGLTTEAVVSENSDHKRLVLDL